MSRFLPEAACADALPSFVVDNLVHTATGRFQRGEMLLVFACLLAGLLAFPSITKAQQQDYSERARQQRLEQLRQRRQAEMRERMRERQEEVQAQVRRNAAPTAPSGVVDQDSLALVALYDSTDGENWKNNDGWLEDPVSDWYGVTVSGDRVIDVNLYDNQLMGEIPRELGKLSSLQLLALNANQLTGEIPPELSQLNSLENLSLQYNQLTGEIPPELSELSSLQDLVLSGNQLTGEIPPELSELSNLHTLFLSDNQLTGEIPAGLSGLSDLFLLNLHRNQLTGEIPPELFELENLHTLVIGSNQLTAGIPPGLSELGSLEWLNLSNNQLTGEIPAELSELSNLENLVLSSNQLTGEIPPELSDLANLKYLYLDSNQLTGAIPLSFTNLTTLSNDENGNFWFDDTDLCEPSDPDFQAWLDSINDVRSTGELCSTSSNVSLVGTYDTKGTALGVSAANGYAYVADREQGLRIVDVSEPSSPTEVGFAITTYASGVAVAEDYAYIGDGQAGLRVIDVSDPTDPTIVSTLDTGYGVGVSMEGDYVYVADVNQGLYVVDISDPANPQQVGIFSTSEGALDVKTEDDYAYLAAKGGGLRVVDVTDPSSPQEVGFVDTGFASGITVEGNYAHVADQEDGLQIVDVSDPTQPQGVAVFDTGDATGVGASGNYVYVGTQQDGLRVIDVSSPSDPQEAGFYQSVESLYGVKVTNGYIYTAATSEGLNIFEFTGGNGGGEPTITSVEPDPVTGSNAPQPFTINGSGFTSSSEVTLRDKRTGEVFPDREISEKTSSSITINPTFTTEAATWTAEVNNPDGGSSGEYEFEVVSPTVAQYPSLSLSTASLTKGNSLTITGRDFSAGGSVSLRVTGPPGFETDQRTLTASSEGAVSTSFSPGSEAPAGKYAVSARDVELGEATSSHSFRVEAASSEEPTFELEVTAPAEGQEFQAGTQVDIRWTDRMTPGANYPTAKGGAIRRYQYRLEISDGGSWTSMGRVPGFKPVGETVSFRTRTQLPFTEGENARIRVTDVYKTDRQAESGAFTVQQPPPSAENLETKLVWDYSFTPRPNSPPAGVAADGTSRLYLVAQKKNADQGPPIERVEVSVATASGNTEKRLTGTVMPAGVTDRYSTEADGADARSVSSNRSRSGSGNEFWFWYVAPKDFKERERDLSRSARMVDASFTVEYADGTTVEDVEQQIEIARPPLMLVHGLGGSPASWNSLTYREDRNGDGNTEKTLLKDSKFFFVREAVSITPDASFKSNASLLLSDNSYTDGFSEILGHMRRLHGYAANQVYYVAHSMGGAVARQLIGTGGTSIGGIPYDRRKNYYQGYVDRLITLDTPHSGSPLADFTEDEIIPSFRGQLELNLGELIAESFLDPFVERKGPVFDETDAVADLVVGQTFPETHVPSHLIAGDVMGVQNRLDLLARPEAERFLNVWNLLIDATQIVNQIANPFSSDKAPGELVLEGIEVATGLGSDGDFIVSTASQLSGLSRDDPATSVFNVTHLETLPRSVMESAEVGTRVYKLLNEPVGGEKFASSIPPSPDIDAPDVQSKLASEAMASLQSNLSKSAEQTVGIEASVPEASVPTDSTLTLRVSAPDTTGLRYLRVYFQNSTRLITEKDSTYELSLPVGGSAVDSQAVTVVASYRRPDTTAIAIDQAVVDVVPASSIQRLEVEPQVMSLREEQARRPDYEAVFEQSIAGLGPGSPDLTASVEDPSVVSFNSDTKSFKGEGAGETAATISYRGKTDVLYFTVSGRSDTTREEPPSGLQVAAGQTGTFELGTTGAEVTISENDDPDGGQLQFASREDTASTDAFEGSATAPDGSTVAPNTASSRYWEITGEDLTDVSFKVRLDTAGIEGIGDPGRLLVLKREDRQSPWTPLNTTREGGVLVSSTLSSFSEFAIGGNTESNPLPVELSSLDAVIEEGHVTVTWTTASETGNARFQIQRETENEKWTTVGSVEGAGTTSEPQSYRFTDADLPYDADRLSYRLQQVDTDGTTTLSDPVVVERGVDTVEFLGTFPNPATQQATVRFALPERQEVQLRLYDALGRQVRTVVNAQKKGRHEEMIDVSELSSGVYFLRLKTETATKTQRFTVVR